MAHKVQIWNTLKMRIGYKSLGKVRPTAEGNWDRTNAYEVLSIVNNPVTNRSYISTQDVPAGTAIDNVQYWQPIMAAGFRDNNIIILTDKDDSGNIKKYTLAEAVASIVSNDRKPGLILGFYGQSGQETESDYSWYLYQFNSTNVNDWNDLSCWTSIYTNVNKFKGYFVNDGLLKEAVPFPTKGDYAYVGDNLEEAMLYICITNGNWSATGKPAISFADRYKAVYSKDAQDFEAVEVSTADRAIADGLGNNIADTYISRENIKEVVKDIVAGTTKEEIGLGNVDNTADADKPVSGPQQQAIDSAKQEVLGLANSLKDIVYNNHATASISVSPNVIFKDEDTQVNVAWNASLSGLTNPTINYTVLKGTDSFATEGTSKQDTVNNTTTYNLTAVIEGVTLTKSATVNAVYPIYARSVNGDVTTLPDNATKYSTPVTSANVTITYNPAETSYLYIFVPDGMTVSSAQLNSSAGNSPLPITKQPDITVDGKGVYHVYRSAMKQVAGSYNVTFKS